MAVVHATDPNNFVSLISPSLYSPILIDLLIQMRETVKVRSDFPPFFPPPAPKNDGDLIFHRCPVSPSLYGYLTHQRGLA